jgi:hypothetical protein
METVELVSKIIGWSICGSVFILAFFGVLYLKEKIKAWKDKSAKKD